MGLSWFDIPIIGDIAKGYVKQYGGDEALYELGLAERPLGAPASTVGNPDSGVASVAADRFVAPKSLKPKSGFDRFKKPTGDPIEAVAARFSGGPQGG